MAFQCISASAQAALPLTGGGGNTPLSFFASASGRYFGATHAGNSYEVVPVPRESLWRARIRSLESGCEIEARIFAFKELAGAKAWLQSRALRLGGRR